MKIFFKGRIMWECLLNMQEALGSVTNTMYDQTWFYTPVIPVLRKRRQDGHNFIIIVAY